ncbi:hypothetical protein [Clostridium sp. 1xD42-85]|uniref:hypothetical protein n=1 Tax=Clostridium sp. 1xD42-85 TaxID=2320084 RepID=UPI0015FECBBE|nr:hypothetical protein [Clostridium sp. 1xD42-85]
MVWKIRGGTILALFFRKRAFYFHHLKELTKANILFATFIQQIPKTEATNAKKIGRFDLKNQIHSKEE